MRSLVSDSHNGHELGRGDGKVLGVLNGCPEGNPFGFDVGWREGATEGEKLGWTDGYR